MYLLGLTRSLYLLGFVRAAVALESRWSYENYCRIITSTSTPICAADLRAILVLNGSSLSGNRNAGASVTRRIIKGATLSAIWSSSVTITPSERSDFHVGATCAAAATIREGAGKEARRSCRMQRVDARNRCTYRFLEQSREARVQLRRSELRVFRRAPRITATRGRAKIAPPTPAVTHAAPDPDYNYRD